ASAALFTPFSRRRPGIGAAQPHWSRGRKLGAIFESVPPNPNRSVPESQAVLGATVMERVCWGYPKTYDLENLLRAGRICAGSSRATAQRARSRFGRRPKREREGARID